MSFWENIHFCICYDLENSFLKRMAKTRVEMYFYNRKIQKKTLQFIYGLCFLYSILLILWFIS